MSRALCLMVLRFTIATRDALLLTSEKQASKSTPCENRMRFF
jgi:hypothetical protein